MFSYEYHKDSWSTFREGIKREWAMTNGIGGYAGSSLIGAQTRTHQGYLIASLHPPIERYLVFSKINESVDRYSFETSQHLDGDESRCSFKTSQHPGGDESRYSFETSQHLDGDKSCYTEGQRYLTGFSYDGSVHYRYETDDIVLEKHITLKQNENVCAVAYEVENSGADAVLTLVPLFNFREHSSLSKKEDLRFAVAKHGRTLVLTPDSHKDFSILFQISEGSFEENPVPFDVGIQLQIEVDLETEGLDCHYCPVSIPISLPAGCRKKISVLCQVRPVGIGNPDISEISGAPAISGVSELSHSSSIASLPEISAEAAFALLEERKHDTMELLAAAGYRNEFASRLVLASDQFLCHRASTGLGTVLAGLPWFTDWGRDTMIAFTGLTLCTGRFQDAEDILLTFSRYIRNGIVPNMFPDDNTPPLYNTADASLWYFYAVWQYLNYVNTPKAEDFIKKEIYPHLTEIIHAYQNGTDFSIYMDSDGLIHAGSGLDQITWMDVRVGDWVVTPRHGKPVEINALWYNALKIMETLTERFFVKDSSGIRSAAGDAALLQGQGGAAVFSAADYHKLAARVRESFCKKFWNPRKGCLYDVIGDDGEPDDSLRPNQIYAVSLPFSLLSSAQEQSIVGVVERELYAGCGLRSLSKDHADYHGIYCGSLPKRDAAYHQGTAWGFLLGGFLTAYLKVHGHSPESVEHALTLLLPVKEHLTDRGCIGSISEIFDGDAPHHPRGCYAQAWSVGEVLRAYTEDILPYLP